MDIRLPGWVFTIRKNGKNTLLLIQVDNLRKAAAELKKQNPDYRVVHIERHYGATA